MYLLHSGRWTCEDGISGWLTSWCAVFWQKSAHVWATVFNFECYSCLQFPTGYISRWLEEFQPLPRCDPLLCQRMFLYRKYWMARSVHGWSPQGDCVQKRRHYAAWRANVSMKSTENPPSKRLDCREIWVALHITNIDCQEHDSQEK